MEIVLDNETHIGYIMLYTSLDVSHGKSFVTVRSPIPITLFKFPCAVITKYKEFVYVISSGQKNPLCY